MRVLLELLRIILIFALLGGLLGVCLEYLYGSFGFDAEPYGWTGFITIFLLLFVLYRNKLQFSAWYKGKGKKKLPSKITNTLILFSIFLIVMSPVLSYLFD
ncbi:hypothetical protein [Virgibacillus sp. DJP39]|uniref:hypothetical protein n=1 Tax=Virgibacillus sp. DJP39 TaxID=3409790 RepID=UPI003BB7BACF